MSHDRRIDILGIDEALASRAYFAPTATLFTVLAESDERPVKVVTRDASRRYKYLSVTLESGRTCAFGGRYARKHEVSFDIVDSRKRLVVWCDSHVDTPILGCLW